MKQFNDDAENLEIMAEEAAEVIEVLSRIIRIKSKVIRFGMDDYHPGNGAPNKEALETEVGHFIGMVRILTSRGVLSWGNIDEAAEAKILKLPNWYKG